MDNSNIINILDLGSTKLRFAVFDNQLNEKFSESKNVVLNDDYSDHFEQINYIIKKAEKKISSHIQDIVLTLDCKDLFIVDLSLRKDTDSKVKINKVYENLILEINQIINNYYDDYEILHILISKCVIDNEFYTDIPKNKKYFKNIKVDFKIICSKKKLLKNLRNIFNKNNLNIERIFCTSYIKSLFYLSKVDYPKISFLEIGWRRTSFIFYENNKLKFINSIPIGGFHITKDISKIFNVSMNDAERIKKSFNKSNTEFSYKSDSDNDDIQLKEFISKKISINLLKKVILYRVQEIIDMAIINSENFDNKKILKETKLFLTGRGSLIFKNNSFYLRDKFDFNTINFFNETDNQICSAGLVYFLNNYQIQKKISKNIGLFEKFFNFFSK